MKMAFISELDHMQNVFYPFKLNPISSKKVIFPIPYKTRETIPYIIKHLELGKFEPVIDKEYSLSEISEAYKYVIKGEKNGKRFDKAN